MTKDNLERWTLVFLCIASLCQAITIFKIQNRASDLQQRVEHLEKAK